jgi:hypothetical protein
MDTQQTSSPERWYDYNIFHHRTEINRITNIQVYNTKTHITTKLEGLMSELQIWQHGTWSAPISPERWCVLFVFFIIVLRHPTNKKKAGNQQKDRRGKTHTMISGMPSDIQRKDLTALALKPGWAKALS